MPREITWEKELELAEGYASDGPGEWPYEHLLRCLNNAEEKAKLQGVEVSERIARIKATWKNKL